MHKPDQEQWDAALHVLRYIKGTLGWGLFLRADFDLKLRAFYDSNWASSPITRRSLIRFFYFPRPLSYLLEV